jgi:hypothetical protein
MLPRSRVQNLKEKRMKHVVKISSITVLGLMCASLPAVAAMNTNTNSITNTNPNASTAGSHSAGSIARWDSENTYWRENYSMRPYYSQDRNYSIYEPAYRYGVDAYHRNNGRSYSEIDQEQMRKGWEQARGDSTLDWNDAQNATRDAYTRMQENSKSAAQQ